MFSGKTEELLRRVKRAEIAKQSITTIKPLVDKRYSETEVVSHNKASMPCITVTKASEILPHCININVLAIDEAQFFDAQLVNICMQAANNGLRVIVAGLDMDFEGEPFGSIPSLCAIADHVTKLHAICVHCGALAQFSHRLSPQKEQIVLGELNVYEPLCRKCYIKAKN